MREIWNDKEKSWQVVEKSLLEDVSDIVNGESGFDASGAAGIRNELPKDERKRLLARIKLTLICAHKNQRPVETIFEIISRQLVEAKLTPPERQ